MGDAFDFDAAVFNNFIDGDFLLEEELTTGLVINKFFCKPRFIGHLTSRGKKTVMNRFLKEVGAWDEEKHKSWKQKYYETD